MSCLGANLNHVAFLERLSWTAAAGELGKPPAEPPRPTPNRVALLVATLYWSSMFVTWVQESGFSACLRVRTILVAPRYAVLRRRARPLLSPHAQVSSATWRRHTSAAPCCVGRWPCRASFLVAPAAHAAAASLFSSHPSSHLFSRSLISLLRDAGLSMGRYHGRVQLADRTRSHLPFQPLLIYFPAHPDARFLHNAAGTVGAVACAVPCANSAEVAHFRLRTR